MKSNFFLFVKEISEYILDNFKEDSKILILTPSTVDGLASTALLFHFLYFNNYKKIHISFVDSIDKNFYKKLSQYKYDFLFLLDFGSIHTNLILEYGKHFKKIFIIDHKDFLEKKKIISKNIFNINPKVFGIDGFKEISTSGVIYLLLKELGHDFYEIEYLSLVGAIGDFQYYPSFIGINADICNILLEKGIITKKIGLKIPGIFNKPLYKALESATEIFIPGISGDEVQSKKLLKNLKIPFKKNSDFTTFGDLTEEESKRIIEEIKKIRLKKNLYEAEDILSPIYLINNREDLIFKDLYEISHVIQINGLENKEYLSILFNFSKKWNETTYDTYLDHKNILIKYIKTIYENRNNISKLNNTYLLKIENKNYVPSIADTLFKSGIFPNKTLFLVYAEDNDKIYLSLRISGKSDYKDLYKSIIEAINKTPNSSLWGKDVFGGAIISINKLPEFLRNFRISAKKNNLIFN